MTRTLLVLGSLVTMYLDAVGCDICKPGGQPLSWEIAEAKAVVFGSITSVKLAENGLSGSSELTIENTLKAHPALAGKKSIQLPRLVPKDEKVRYLILLDVLKDELDPYRVFVLKSDTGIVNYVKEAPPLPDKGDTRKRSERLRYFFSHLASPDTTIATDAYVEWSVHTNLEAVEAARGLSADKVSQALLDPKTPVQNLGLLAFILGNCGGAREAELLKAWLLHPNERINANLDGILAGYIQLEPEAGWKLVFDILGDRQRPFTERYTLLRLLRFYRNFERDREKFRDQVRRGLVLLLQQDDTLDLAVEQLRQWKIWDYTDVVLSRFGQKGADSPLTKRAIVRYALKCEKPEAKEFVAKVRQADPNLVRSVEELLEFEKGIQ